MLAADGVVARDCASADRTFVDGQRIKEVRLSAGRTLRSAEAELLVETTQVTIAIPRFDLPRPAPPVVLSDGSLICPRHPRARATHQCTHCREVLCDDCVHRLQRRGGKLMEFCPLCSHPCLTIAPEKRKKQSLFRLCRKTVKLPSFHGPEEL